MVGNPPPSPPSAVNNVVYTNPQPTQPTNHNDAVSYINSNNNNEAAATNNANDVPPYAVASNAAVGASTSGVLQQTYYCGYSWDWVIDNCAM